MKLNRNFVMKMNGQEAFLVPVSKSKFSGVINWSNTLGEIIFLLENDIAERDLVKKMCERYNTPAEKVICDVKKVISSLRNIGAIIE